MTYKRHSKMDYEDFLNGLFPTDYILRRFKHLINTATDIQLAREGKYGTLLRKNDITFFTAGYRHWAIQIEYEEFKSAQRHKDRHVMPVVRIPSYGKMHVDAQS